VGPPHLPPLEVRPRAGSTAPPQSFDGAAWVGLVPFFLRVGLPGVAPVPWASQFPETNVRTYVCGEDGTSGIWFFSLDAARLGAVLVARWTYRLPYFWSNMAVERSGSTISYRSRRWWPRPRGATSEVVIEIGDRFEPEGLEELDHFLTARWALFSAPRSGLRHAQAFHDPWPLHRGRVVCLHDDLVVAAGLPAPKEQPLVHYSPRSRSASAGRRGSCARRPSAPAGHGVGAIVALVQPRRHRNLCTRLVPGATPSDRGEEIAPFPLMWRLANVGPWAPS
jgi:uncharacterized protein YqjF (DUF2071 family)